MQGIDAEVQRRFEAEFADISDRVQPLDDLYDLSLCLDQFREPGDDSSPFVFGAPVSAGNGLGVCAWLVHPVVYAQIEQATHGTPGVDAADLQELPTRGPVERLLTRAAQDFDGHTFVSAEAFVRRLPKLRDALERGDFAPIAVGRGRYAEAVLDSHRHYARLAVAYIDVQRSRSLATERDQVGASSAPKLPQQWIQHETGAGPRGTQPNIAAKYAGIPGQRVAPSPSPSNGSSSAHTPQPARGNRLGSGGVDPGRG